MRAVQERRAVAPVAPSRRGHAVRPLALVTAVVVIAIDHATKWWAINALDERDIDHDLEGEILRNGYLTEDQKQTLIKVYQSFRHENEDRMMSPVTSIDEPCLLYTSPSPRDRTRSRMPSSA